MTDNLSKEILKEDCEFHEAKESTPLMNVCIQQFALLSSYSSFHHIVLFIFKKKKKKKSFVDRLFTVILMTWETAIKIFIPHRGSSLIHRIDLKNCYT